MNLRNFTYVCVVGGTNLPLTIQMCVKFSDFVEPVLYLHSLGPIKHGTFTDMRPSFQQCQWIFTNWSMISIFPCVYQ